MAGIQCVCESPRNLYVAKVSGRASYVVYTGKTWALP